MSNPSTSSGTGIVLRGEDDLIAGRAKRAGLPVVVMEGNQEGNHKGLPLPWEKTLFVEAGTCVPWDLLPAAWHFLERWDAAVPLWKYGVLAADVGTAAERKATQAIVRDLRVLLHAVELVFARKHPAGEERKQKSGRLSFSGGDLMAMWAEELARFPEGDRRLAFLRAVYQVKPRLCVLPVTWLADVRQASRQAMIGGRAVRGSANAGKPLVRIELEPGRFVKVHEGDEEKARAQFERTRGRRPAAPSAGSGTEGTGGG